MQNRLWIPLFGLLVLAGLVWYAASHPLHSPPPDVGMTATSTPPMTYAEDEPYYTIDAEWPQAAPFPGDGNPAAVLRIKNWVQDRIVEFKKNGNFDNLTQEDIQMMGFDQGRKEAIEIKYEVKTSPHTTSYVYTIYEDTGGAHPNLYYQTFAFNANGDFLALADIFKAPNYLDRLSAKARASLPALIENVSGTPGDADYIRSGTEPTLENFSNFYFEGTDFVLVFPPYQVGPYALGTITLRIPASELKDILNPQYP